MQKMRTNGESARKHPESESFVRHWPAYAEFEMLSIPAKKSLACVRQNGRKRKIVNRCWWWCRRGRGAGLCTKVNSIPRLAHSLNCNHSTLIKCSQCPEGLKDEFLGVMKGLEEKRDWSGQTSRGTRNMEGDKEKQRIQRSNWWWCCGRSKGNNHWGKGCIIFFKGPSSSSQSIPVLWSIVSCISWFSIWPNIILNLYPQPYISSPIVKTLGDFLIDICCLANNKWVYVIVDVSVVGTIKCFKFHLTCNTLLGGGVVMSDKVSHTQRLSD